MKNVKLELRKWYSTSHCKLQFEIDELSKTVTEWEIKAESSNLDETQRLQWMEDRESLIQKEKNQMEMLKQKSRYKWAFEGDENCKFFHSVIRRRQHKNNIHGINIAGIWSTNPTEIKRGAHNHFKSLFKTPLGKKFKLKNWSGPCLDISKAELLEARFTEIETLDAIKSCGPNKAPRPDGFNMLFYTKF
ncbi:uncharacterized protein [Rutidosis leptorrhynchoides]|uniref:uncharacterized protein n=1 Tax=Rutidosis leptorrhynchoides TaxID=125765 RepID=UPI003A9A15FA